MPEDKINACMDCYQFGYHHSDKTGNPVFIDRVGHANLTTLKDNISTEEFLRWHTYGWELNLEEQFPACSEAFGCLVERNLVILDLAGLNVSDAMDSSVQDLLKRMTAQDSANYPEMLDKMFIVNAPFTFRAVWSIISTFLDPNTLKKITVLGGQDVFLPQLLERIDRDKIPDFLGGDCHCDGGCVKASPGPWAAYPKSKKRDGPWQPTRRGRSSSVIVHRRLHSGSEASMASLDEFYTPDTSACTTPRYGDMGVSEDYTRNNLEEAKRRLEQKKAEEEAAASCWTCYGCCMPAKAPEERPAVQATPPVKQATPVGAIFGGDSGDASKWDEPATFVDQVPLLQYCYSPPSLVRLVLLFDRRVLT
jgi:hypothetical protein